MYCEPRVTLLNSITALCDYVNQAYNIYFDSTGQTVVAQLLTHGINLPDSEGIPRINVNSAIFSQFSQYILSQYIFLSMYFLNISQTCRFMKQL